MNAAQAALQANTPQDAYTTGTKNPFYTPIQTHTPFSISQRSISLNGINGFLGQKVVVNMRPRDCGDLLNNMYLKFSLPTGTYIDNVGRAIISEVDFIVGNTTIEALTDDWYILKDQLFLDADEQLGLNQAVNGQYIGYGPTYDFIVPLEFFFTKKNQNFPVCAIDTDNISVVFYFNNQSWITNSEQPIDLIHPYLIIEEINLGIMERLYYKTNPITLIIPLAYKEAIVDYSGNKAIVHLAANFNVSMLIWFIRNKQYENGGSQYYKYRYSYGYTSQHIHSAIPVQNYNGTTNNYVDTVDTVSLWFNNHQVFKFATDGIYHSIKQPFDHKLTVPTESIYMYCFTESPKKFDTSGSVNFSTLDYSTTHIDISFNPKYAPAIQSEYSLNLYYYGYIPLTIANGTCGF
jgi:hypothetical protein